MPYPWKRKLRHDSTTSPWFMTPVSDGGRSSVTSKGVQLERSVMTSMRRKRFVPRYHEICPSNDFVGGNSVSCFDISEYACVGHLGWKVLVVKPSGEVFPPNNYKVGADRIVGRIPLVELSLKFQRSSGQHLRKSRQGHGYTLFVRLFFTQNQTTTTKKTMIVPDVHE